MAGEARRRLLLSAGLLFCCAGAYAAGVLLHARPAPQLRIPLLGAVTALAAYLAYRLQRHVRAERQAWEQLAATTDELNRTSDQGSIMRAAAYGSRDLIGAKLVEIDLWGAGQPRLVRVDKAGVLYDGPPAGAPPVSGRIAGCAIAAGSSAPIGSMHLHLPRRLTGREHSILRTMAIALATAIANANAYEGALAKARNAAQQARRDALTGLVNRRGLLDILDEQLSSDVPHRPTLAMLDLDQFKQVNDTLGHAAGDQLLITVAQRLQVTAAAHNAITARLGGDEFAILFSDATSGAAMSNAESVASCLDAPVEVHGMSIVVRGSTGVAIGQPGISGSELLRRADHAMYRAKRGRVPVVLYHEDSSLPAPHTISTDLSRALSAGEITVQIQPIVHLGSGEPAAIEALPSWDLIGCHPIEPSTWLDLVTRPDQLTTATEYILDQALAAAAKLRKAGLELPLILNIPQSCLLDIRFPHTVLGRLQFHRHNPHDLTLELTETAGLSNVDAVRQTLARLRKAGIRLSVDRFGESHSTLSVLTRLPFVDGLKIAPMIVENLGKSPQSELVVRAATRLGEDLGISDRVWAEGVTTTAQRQALWDLGCKAGQGPFFGPPTSVEQMVDRLRDSRTGFLTSSLSH